MINTGFFSQISAISILLSSVCAFIISVSLTPIIRKIAIKTNKFDPPSSRKIHTESIPRLGGIAMYISFIVCCLVFSNLTPISLGILLGASFLVIIGILDDIYTIPPSIKLLSQIFAALIAVDSGVVISSITTVSSQLISLQNFSIPITLFWIVSMINIINLIDGLDGLAGSISGIAISSFLVIAAIHHQWLAVFIGMTLLGSILGFLKHNLFPAKIFMGDTGSMLLGYGLGCISIIGVVNTPTPTSILIPLIVLGIPVTDTLYAIYRRIKRKQHIFLPDRDHIHHQLLNQGLSQKQVTLLCTIWTLVLGGCAIGLSQTGGTTYLTVASLLFFSFLVILSVITKHRRPTNTPSSVQHDL